MLITTVTVFILLVVYLIPTKGKEKELETNLEVEYITGLGTNSIYLLNENGYLTKTKVLLTSDQKEDQVKQLIETLTLGKNSKFPNKLSAVIPEKTKLKQVKIEDKMVSLDFSSDFLKVKEPYEERLIEAITYSIFDLKGVEGIKITVEGEPLRELPHSKKVLPEVLTRQFGINKVYDIDHRNGINKVTIYYLEEIEGNHYYVPVTKYVNDARDKIKIIVDNLTSSYIYEPNLMSFLNQDVKLLDYSVEDQLMILNFNDSIFTDQSQILEEVVYSLAYSVFDNYDVNEVVFEVNSQQILKKSLNSLE